MTQDMNHTITKVLKAMLVAAMISLTGGNAIAQVKVKGNVYGGGNAADVQTNTEVNISAGQVEGNVYGGGNLGDVGTIVKSADYNYKWTNETNPGDTYTYNSTGVCTVSISGGTIGANGKSTANHASGHVFGAGKGKDDSFYCEKGMVYKTSVTISKGTVYGNVYGGGEVGRVENDATVIIEGANENDTEIKGGVFGAGAGVATHGYSALLRGDATVTVQGKAKVGMNVYGGGENASVGRFRVENSLPKEPLSGGTCTVTIQGDAQVGTGSDGGSVYGACKGVEPDYDNNSSAGHVINTGQSVSFTDKDDYLAFLKTLALTSNTNVTIDGNASVNGSVYGGGRRGVTLGNVAVNMTGGTVTNDVYGGGALADTNTGNWNDGYGTVTGITANTTIVTGYYTRSGEGTTASPYEYSEITAADTKAAANTTYYSKDSWAHATLKSAYYTTTVSLTGGTISRDAYGGGLGDANTPAYVWGDVLVDLNGTTTYDTNGTVQTNPISTKGCIVNRVFGCNNVNGTPKGEVLVHVHATQKEGGSSVADKTTGTYDVQAVYGGGNQAEYYPVRADDTETETSHVHTNVIIDGCDYSSIESVYGGGNAASTPATCVTVNGAYEIGELFGGGNGFGDGNPGANVGFHAYDAASEDYDTPTERATRAYGFGKAQVNVGGGTIHAVFGGSNSKGNVREVAIAMLDENDENCTFAVGKAYGGGKAAEMDGRAVLQLGCVPRVDEVYGGAESAAIHNDVELTITNGTYKRIFGGNNKSGSIDGKITINIEETGCTPIVIGQIFAGGNEAAYTTPAGKDDPVINVKSFTSIGEIYGGGFGPTAILTGNPTINIDEIVGDKASAYTETTFEYNKDTNDTSDDYTVVVPAHTTANTIGTIGDVYGGGYGADVDGNVTVNIGTQEKIELETTPHRSGITADADGKYTVTGVDIARSVYGGGYGAATTVTGNVAVNIGGEKTVGEGSSATTSFIGGDITIGGSVYGGSAFGAVNATKGNSGLSGTSNATTAVTLKKGTITGAVYGGGMGDLASLGNDHSNVTAQVYGDATVTLYGDVIAGGIYGGCNLNGTMNGKTQLDLLGGTIGTPFTSVPNTGVPEIVFGGGLGAMTTVVGDVTVNVNNSTKTPDGVLIYSNVYGGSKNGSVAVANVNLLGGTIWGNVFGGGYQTADGKTAATDVNVTLDGTKFACLYSGTGDDAIPQTGQIFGCNNLKGSPTGHVKVWVKKTVDSDKVGTTAPTARTTYDVAAVYGGGNLADYVPSDALLDATVSDNQDKINAACTEVLIEGCELTSINAVYGGGNAAAVPATNVNVNGSYIINRLYGGGNGADTSKPGADVGKYKVNNVSTNYGTGKAVTKLNGGYINSVFGGSNTQGDIVGGTDVQTKGKNETAPVGSCPNLIIGNLYGAGSHADVEGDVNIILECMPEDYVAAVYGGAEEAIIKGNVSLTVTSGKFGRVFGGNNKGGSINGTITVNVKEEGCKDLEIGELYGGGNLAPYSKYGCYYDENETDETKRWKAYEAKSDANDKFEVTIGSNELYPYHVRVLVESCTSIGKIFGGGLGSTAKVTGDTYVNVNMMYGNVNGTDKTTLGHIGQVFGGGSLADVKGDTRIDIGTATTTNNEDIGVKIIKTIGESGSEDYNNTKYLDPETDQYISLEAGVYGGGMNANVDGNTTINIGTVVQSLGTLIEGNVYGGGKEGDVTGTTQVNVCAIKNTDNTYSSATLSAAGVTITGDVFGAGQGVATDVTKALVSGDSKVVMGNGSVKKSVYGGGELSQVAGNTDISIVGGTIGTANLGGATYGNVYGGGKGNTTDVAAGLIKGDTKIAISGGTILHNIYGGGAYGSVGTFTYDTDNTNEVPDGTITDYTSGGKAEIEITGGTIGSTGKENGMVFGSSRGDVGGPGEIHDRLAWVYDTEVKIGTSGSDSGPQINGSIYGGGENGHNYHDAGVYIYSGTIGIASGVKVTSNGIEYEGAAYPYRGNVYGGGCGTDKYYSDPSLIIGNHTANDGEGDKYNPIAGIVQGDATITITGGTIVRNVYGAGAMGSVGIITKDNTGAVTITSGGATAIAISGGTIGVSGTAGDGNVYGAARGDKDFTDRDLALVNETSVTISGSTATTQIKGNVYGGGEVGNVQTNTTVDVQGGAIAKNVFGGGKGVEDLFTCEQAMVGVEGEGAGANLDSETNKIKGTCVTVSNGTVGTLNAGVLVEGTGNVYGGGEIGRVEWNTRVTIGESNASGTAPAPLIYGSVFGAGKGLETHGYSALVRGNSTVTVQGKAKVEHNVYGGGEKSTVGRYWVKGINNVDSNGDPVAGAPTAPSDLPVGMPYQKQSGGVCKVTVQGNAQVGPDGGASDFAGHVFGAGKGVEPHFVASGQAGASQKMTGNNQLVSFTDDSNTGKTAKELYLEFLQTLALVTNTYVIIGTQGASTGPAVKGSVYGGSESGFVQTNTDVDILSGTINGDAFGGGLGLASFAEAGKVKGNTDITVSGGAVEGNVYGGGRLGDVGTITKPADYNYLWSKTDGVTANTSGNNKITGDNANTGICKVTVSGGTIGVNDPEDATAQGNVFGAGEGLATTWWCEKATVYATDVSVTGGTVKGNVYGGGQIGRVEDDAKVTIGAPSGTDVFEIKGSVFGAGAGKHTHGYSALVRGNADVTVQGKAQIGGSVYGGGEIASVGKFNVVGGLPRDPLSGGTCTVMIKDNASITGEVFGACKGVNPTNIASADRKSMQLSTNAPSDHSLWSYYDNDENSPFIWRYYPDEAAYLDFLETLALTSNTDVTIDGSAIISESVYGGGQRGITLGSVKVDMLGGTVTKDVYGGGALANTNSSMWDKTNNKLLDYVKVAGLTAGESLVKGYYTKSGETYTLITSETDKAVENTDYYTFYTTTVNLKGGTINGNAYGGALGQRESGTAGDPDYKADIPAYVYGDVTVKLNEGKAKTVKGCIVDKVFGCNNLNGTPKGHVQVYVYATQNKNAIYTTIGSNKTPDLLHTGMEDEGAETTYDVTAVYGGGNLAPYDPEDAYSTDEDVKAAAQSEVYIYGCDLTSIKQVYGGGNAASAPATYVRVDGAYEIEELFGGGNGKDDYVIDGKYYDNPGANVGYKNYSHLDGTGTGTETDPFNCVDNDDAKTKEDRQAAANNYMYGSGVAHVEVFGGKIHASYGGSNEKGNISTKAWSKYEEGGMCDLDVPETYGGGKNSLIDGEIVLDIGCTTYMPVIFGGSRDADVNSDIVLNITNGKYDQVFGGNNNSGNINGSITVNIKENGCVPIEIGELYLGGYLAGYSIYGYYQDASDGNKWKPRTKAQYDALSATEKAAEGLSTPRKFPRINVISATSIGDIYGGGYQATVVGDPHINVNMEQGKVEVTRTLKDGTTDEYIHKDYNNHEYATDEYTIETAGDRYFAILPIGEIGNIYGGGNEADIIGDTYVEIGTGTNHDDNGDLVEITPTRNAAHITGNVFGGGKGKEDTFTCEKAMVGQEGDGVGADGKLKEGGTHIIIGNGTVGTILENGTLKAGTGNVYGGGEIGRVERNTSVTIGLESGDGKPVVWGNVFGGGKGLETHGYSALVRGTTTVTIQGDAKIGQSVYGGGEIASVGNFFVTGVNYPAELNAPQAPTGLPDGMPYALKYPKTASGTCYVTIRGNAEIGPDDMQMPTFSGNVFGAGKGILPNEYEYSGDDKHYTGTKPRRMQGGNTWDTFTTEPAYIEFIETLGMSAATEVTIDGNAFVKGSVYGGSENGHVLNDTHVTIVDGQIGNGSGAGKNSRFDWTTESPANFSECASWDFGRAVGAAKVYLPYDVYDLDSNNKPKAASDGHTFYGNVFGGGSGYFPYRHNPAWVKDNAKSTEVGQPVDKNGYSDGIWLRSAGAVYGNTYVHIKGGHILTSVYGGNECTDVGKYLTNSTTPEDGTGICTVNMTGGTIGVPRTEAQIEAHPVTCCLYGAGKGDQRINFNTWTNVANTIVNVTGTARIYGSVFGGGEDGHIIGNAETTIGGSVTIGENNYNYNDVTIGTTGNSGCDGNVFGGGRGFSGDAQTAGTIGGNVKVNIEKGSVLGNVYGGGRLASVGTMFEYPVQSDGTPNPAYGNFKEDDANGAYGHVTININGGIVGNSEGSLVSGNVYGGSMGHLELLNGKRNLIWPKMAQVKTAAVNIYGDAVIRRNVYGGGELGTVRDNASVTIGGYLNPVVTDGSDNSFKLNPVKSDSTITVSGSPTVRRDVYGGGYGSEDRGYTIFTVNELESDNNYHSHTYAFTPMQFAGCVGMNTFVNIAGGYIRKSVYGGGEMASVGVINYRAEKLNGASTSGKIVIHDDESGEDYFYSNMVKHEDVTKEFALSWPYEFNYVPTYDGGTHINITGGRLGLKDSDEDNTDIAADNGDVYGAGKGQAGDYKDFVFCANVGSTDVTIDYPSTPTEYSGDGDCIAGAVYGGGEDGHVMGNTKLTLKKGLVYHSIYGGGSGKGKFTKTLSKTTNVSNVTDHSPTSAATPPTQTETTYEASCYSITAGKVFGNTEVNMEGGYVVRNVYGGGNMGSVGKGNYAGGADDYSTSGYGEKVDNLWSGSGKFSQAFLNSGKCIVKITGGTIGYIDSSDPSNSMYPWNSTASLPYGNVFGGCRGESAPNISDSPRYLYSPEFFVGYANETSVEIGKADGTGPTILGSVYGGGMDGHIRRDAHVIIKGGEIGIPFTDANKTKVKAADPNDIQWLARGNVYGAGSGIGKYKYDFNYDGDYLDEVDYKMSETRTVRTKEEDFSTSAGSVTRFTTVEVEGGTIHRNVYGGGSLSSVGAPKIPPITDDPIRRDDSDAGKATRGKQSLNQVIISGDATIGDASSFAAGYGGYVFGSSRGDENLSNPASYATAVWTDVHVDGGTIAGDVYGGGEVGSVRQSTEVKLTGGVITHDAYGGGKGTTAIAANVGGDAVVKLNEGKGAGDTGAVVNRLFGANNLNGSPQGNTSVYVYATQSADSEHTTIGSKFAKHTDLETEGATSTYDVLAVYGGGNEAAYVPASPYTASNTTGARSQVIIEGCDLTSIKTVYGGGNAASVPETNVNIKSAYEIEDVFGGGNGKDKKSDGSDNPGADIGVYKNASAESVRYGTGNVNVNAEGGYIHELFGASNQKGDIKGDVNLKMQQVGDCTLKIDKVYNAGRNADIEGNLISVLSCQPTEKVLEYYGGAENANVKGNVELTITNGWFGKVFAGNNQSGAILGHVKLNVEETGCNPIKIDELYGCGNDAAYSVYGYYVKTTEADGVGANTETPDLKDDKLVLLPRTSADDPHLPVKTFSSTEHTWTVYEGTSEEDTFKPYADPELNIVSATYIGKVFGGGYGENGTVYGNPTVNINMIPGDYASGVPAFAQDENIDVSDNTKNLGVIGDVFGGGNAADVIGDPVINIGTADKVKLHLSWDKAAAKYTMSEEKTVEGAYIAGSVYGAGKGLDDTFTCEKAMVGIDGDGVDHPDGGTTVNIANGMVLGNVYGGGEIGRVEKNTKVTIGLESGTGSPVVKGNVFGGGKGKETHGYSALVRGNPTVIVQGNAKIKKSVYGGGEIASVARYKVAETDEEAAANGVKKGMPYALKSANSGYCTVIVRDNAEIGPDGMQMTAADGPDDTGYVFGAGKGILPKVYTYADDEHKPKRMVNNGGTSEWEYFANEDAYIQFIQTLALATHTDVTISGNAFVKGSVYGGSENGLVQYDTDVKIEGGQIGCGKNTTERYGDEVWAADYTPTTDLDCPSWEYKAPFAPYDPYAKYKNPADGKYYYDAAFTQYAEGGASVATDGHTYYGNVFGGGSGSVPYFNTIEGRSEYLSSAGQVKGNTTVTISGGHILTNVYGGCEATNVLGTANVTMTGGTVGVPRTDERIIAHPLTGYLFGAGKGDQRIFFNKETNVNHSVVKIEGGKIYGSVYGGGEDGHVLGNVSMTIGKAGSTTVPTIGTKGTSYYDGNVFGGGRGFGGEALTAGNVGGAITLDIEGGEMLGSVYGGGRLASVGYGLYLTTETGYGVMRADDEYDGSYTNPSTDPAATFFNKGRGKITVNVKGGTIGNDETNAAYGGNVFGGSMGRLTKLDGSDFDDANHWSLLATVKQTTVNVSGGTIKRSVYGGGELGTVTTDAIVNVSGGTIGTTGKGGAEFGNVYGGGKGYVDPAGSNYITAGIIKGNTTVNISQADSKTTTIYHNIYGGGAYGSVGTFTYDANNVITGYTSGGKATISITGGAIGEDGNENGMIFGSSRGDVGAPGSIHDKLAWVYDTEVTINGGQINGSVYGGGENGHNYHDAVVNIQKGTIGISSGKPIGTYTDGGASYPYRGNVYGGGCGTDKYYEDPALETHDGNGQLYNLLAGIVRGDATINISGGTVVHNVYGAGAMGSVGITNADGTISGGQTTIKISGGTIGVDGTAGEGNVFGAARGSLDAPENDLALVSGNTSVSITGGTMYGNVYGGGELGYVGKYTTVTDATSGSKTNTWPANTGLCEVTINGGGASVKGHVFGAGKGSANTFECEPAMVHQTNVSIMKGTVNGNVYGGGQLGRVENNTAVTIGDGSSEPVIDGDVFGAGAGVATHGYSALVRGDSRVTVQGKAKVGGSVYGGGETASVGRFKVVNSLPKEPLSGGTCTVTIQDDAQIGTGGEGHVFGACKGVEPDYANNAGHVINTGESKSFANEAEYLAFLKTLALTSNTVVTIGGNTSVNGSVFGGGQRGITLGNVNVDMTGGTVVEDVYGGGALADTNTGNTSDYGTSTESINSTSTYTTTVNLLGGTINDVYGGGLGQKIGDVNGGTSDVEAIVYGDVNVNLNGLEPADYVADIHSTLVSDVDDTDGTYYRTADGCIVTGRVFGCNNINGTPKGHTKVHVFKTVAKAGQATDGYDVAAVYGGGNAADYVPAETDTKQSTEVIIEGCDLTSIEDVYGGGYGAATPGTNVLVRGTKIINNIFGGGYGAGTNNPGANVGYLTGEGEVIVGPAYTSGEGKAVVRLMAGTVNNVYGGSNTKGDIRGGSSVTNVANDGGPGCCDKLTVAEIYGGGKSADMYGGAEIVLGCMPNDWIGAIYAGAENADVGGDVGLTLTSGKFERVFGGNNKGGTIDGYIEVNIEENPECETPIIIGGLYGGGNMAPYAVPAKYTKNNPNYPSPRVNVRAFTSIGNIYGGGFGERAKVTGNPMVNINQVEGGREYAGETKVLEDGSTVTLYARAKDAKMGVIGNVFGGGNAAPVEGNTTVNIGTTSEEQMESLKTTDAEGHVTVVMKPVVGADIRGNVYGGGNQAEVTGDTNVFVGQEKR